MNSNLKGLMASLFLTIMFALAAMGQTTAFNFQGFVKDGSSAANGNYDFEFRLFSAVSGGAQAGSTLSRNAVPVANGIFAVELDFGAPPFPGADRFLEIRVRTTGGGSFTTLNPRTKVGTAPYSTLAATAANSALLGGQSASSYILSGAASINANNQFNIGGDRMLFAPGINNTFVGRNAGANTGISTVDNTAFGASAGSSITLNTSNNSFFGSQAGRESQGGFNSFFGSGAGRDSVSGTSNSFFGALSGMLNTASNNSFFGYQSGKSNIIGTQNSFFGFNSGLTNDGGNENSFFGYETGKATNSSFNTFIGSRAGQANTTGSSNTFMGTAAGTANIGGSDNSFFGVNTGVANISGNGNSYFGRRAGRDTTGSNNTAVGIDAGRNIITGSNNTFIGAGADASGTNLTFATAIGAGAIVDFFDTVVIGRPKDRVKMPGTVEVGGSLHVTGDGFFDTVGLTLMPTPNGGPDVCLHGTLDLLANCASSIRYKSNVSSLTNGLETVLKLRPVSFDWKDTKETEFGFIAEEVDSIDSRLAYRKDGVIEGIRRNGITASIVGAVQAQNLVISSQKEKLLNLENQVQQLIQELDRQRKALESLRSEICLAKPSRSDCGQK